MMKNNTGFNPFGGGYVPPYGNQQGGQQNSYQNNVQDDPQNNSQGGPQNEKENKKQRKKQKKSQKVKTPKTDDRTGSVVTAVKFVLIAAFLLLCLLNSVYTVKETEVAVITTFGKATANEGKGLQFKIPFIQKVTKVNTTVRAFHIGYGVTDNGEEYDIDDESIMITSDYNFIDLDYDISYEVKDPIKFLYASDNPELILKNIAMSSIRSVLSAYTVDAALTTGKTEIQANIRNMIVTQLETEDIGISLVDASMQDVEPPTDEVNDAFKAVETAKQNKESAINEANQYRNEQLPAAEAAADKVLQDAEATKMARINEANGQVARFNEEYAEFIKYPLITKQRMFYETMEELLPGMKIIIDDGSGNVQKIYPVDSFYNNTPNTQAPAESSANQEEENS